MLDGEVSYPDAYFFVKEGATRYFDEDSRVPYAVRDKDWVSYEDPQSVREKVLSVLYVFLDSFDMFFRRRISTVF